MPTSRPYNLAIHPSQQTGKEMNSSPYLSKTDNGTKGSISGSPCTSVRWVPGSTTLFLASHADGTIIIYDVEREDGSFTPLDPNTTPSSASNIPSHNGSADSTNNLTPPVELSSQEWDPLDTIFVTIPPWHPAATSVNAPSKLTKAEVAKNPVSHWRISKQAILGGLFYLLQASSQPMNLDFTFSPDVRYVAAVSEDGCLRVIDALAEE
jgi:WD40 repeat protein